MISHKKTKDAYDFLVFCFIFVSEILDKAKRMFKPTSNKGFPMDRLNKLWVIFAKISAVDTVTINPLTMFLFGETLEQTELVYHCLLFDAPLYFKM